jgi:LysM repeat protein
MKTFALALLVAILIAGQILTPAAAAAPSAPTLTSACGDTYTVQRGDYLTRIARYCGVSYSLVLAYNPQITNPNRIYPGQIIYLTSNSGTGVPVTGGTYIVQRGDTLALIAWRFGTTVAALLAVNPNITNPSLIYVGQVIYLPSGTSGGTTTGTYARVTLSTLSVASGGTVKVTVTGFPAKAEIDYRIGKKGAGYSAVVDGTTDSNGYASATVTIPSSAVKNEQWVVVVMTTSLTRAASVTVTSATITIK